MTFTNEQIAMMQAPLDPKYVVKPSGNFGPKGDYLEGWHVINELNRVFGFGEWSYTIDLTRDVLAEGKNHKGEDQWQAAYTCVCTLTVYGQDSNVVRQAVGFGSGFAKQVGDAIEGATKEAETDALKRAARTFGNVFGLALYDKSRANVQTPPPPRLSDGDLSTIEAKLKTCGIPTAEFLKIAKIKNLKELSPDKVAGALQWMEDNKKMENA